MTKTSSTLLVVPPFECAWLVDDELRFPQPGRGCIAFEACADNDVTVVFKEKAGSKHYRTDIGPNYAIVLGSHRNRRLKIEVDGNVVVDAPGMMVCRSRFQPFWISIYDGIITVGKGDPGKDVLFEWADRNPNRKVQYVGLSSWDKHVGYRNIRLLQYVPFSAALAKNTSKAGRLAHFLENFELSDLQFRVGADERIVPAHRIVVACCCAKFPGNWIIVDNVVTLPSIEYPILHALLEYLYTGGTQVLYSQLATLQDLCAEFGVETLASQCKELANDRANKIPTSTVQVLHRSGVQSVDTRSGFSADAPVDPSKLREFFVNQEYTDVELSIVGYDMALRAHKLVLSAWSDPFAKMFTNEMCESNMSKVKIKDVQPNVFLAMLHFMYSFHLDLDERDDPEVLLLSLLLLADQFGIPLLEQACTQKLLALLSEDCRGHHEAASSTSLCLRADYIEEILQPHYMANCCTAGCSADLSQGLDSDRHFLACRNLSLQSCRWPLHCTVATY